MRQLTLIAVTVVWAAVFPSATSVIPPTFEQLISHAEAVFEGIVIDVQSTLKSEAAGPVITTDVSFQVTRVLKGSGAPVIVLQFLGGTVGNRTMAVEGMPRFAIGDRDLLFVSANKQFVSPLVGLMHGRFRIVNEPTTGREVVRQFDGAPFSNTSRLSAPGAPRVGSDSPMTLSDFENAVAAEIQRQRAGAR